MARHYVISSVVSSSVQDSSSIKLGMNLDTSSVDILSVTYNFKKSLYIFIFKIRRSEKELRGKGLCPKPKP
jgi:hypothetical protein